MPLDPDAQALADALAQTPPFRRLGVQGAREMMASVPAAPPGVQLHDVYDRTLPGPDGEIPVRVYRPSPDAGLPVLLYMHGGGWSIGDLDSCDEALRIIADKVGCIVVSVDYPLAPENPFPAAFEDVRAAAAWLAANAAELGGDPERLAIGGDSAGGNLAAAVVLHSRDHGGPDFRLQVLICATTEYAVERPSWIENSEVAVIHSADVLYFWDQYLPDPAYRTDPRATPMSAASLAGLPPAFIVTAEYDPVRDDGEAYGARLAAEGTPAKVKRYPGAPHDFAVMPMLARAQEALADIAEQLSAAFAVPAEVPER